MDTRSLVWRVYQFRHPSSGRRFLGGRAGIGKRILKGFLQLMRFFGLAGALGLYELANDGPEGESLHGDGEDDDDVGHDEE